MKFIPLAFFNSNQSGSQDTPACYCDKATIRIGGVGQPAARRLTFQYCGTNSTVSNCYGGINHTLYIQKGTNVTVSNTGSCSGGTAGAVTYDRNYCADNETPVYFSFNIINCQTGVNYVCRFYGVSSMKTGYFYNFNDVYVISGGLIPNGCYQIGTITGNPVDFANQNWLYPGNYQRFTSCNECAAATQPTTTTTTTTTIPPPTTYNTCSCLSYDFSSSVDSGATALGIMNCGSGTSGSFYMPPNTNIQLCVVSQSANYFALEGGGAVINFIGTCTTGSCT